MVDIPKISVIIPVYNEEMHLPECLESVLNQSLRDIEIICVDDGSTDGSPDILRRYAFQDSRLKVVRQENQGAGVAQNAGLKAAAGEFICFMGADDYYHDSRALEDLYQAATQNSALVCGGGVLALRDGQISEVDKRKDKNIFPNEGFIAFADFLFVWVYTRYIFQRKLIMDHGIYFPDYRRGQDPVWCANVLETAQRFYALPRIVYIHRQGHRNLNWTPRRKLDVLQCDIDLMRFALAKNYSSLFLLFRDELCDFVDRFRQDDAFPGTRAYYRQWRRLLFYGLMSYISWGSAGLKYRRKRDEARDILARAKARGGGPATAAQLPLVALTAASGRLFFCPCPNRNLRRPELSLSNRRKTPPLQFPCKTKARGLRLKFFVSLARTAAASSTMKLTTARADLQLKLTGIAC